MKPRLLALAALALCASCVAYPRQGVRAAGQRRGFASATDVLALEPGRATRADVLCALGEPDFVLEKETCLAYWTREGKWDGWITVIVSTGHVWWGTDHILYFRFDDGGRLAERHTARRTFRCETFPGWIDASEALRMVNDDRREHRRMP